ncbi:hypothetical protein, partial [Zoogloea oryzae]|uniref:hypothetical protein n=1 Tax=Zoogloea oryzae TaxID=310767 RepID=UPI0024E185A3
MASMVHGTTSDGNQPVSDTTAYRALPALDRLLGAVPALIEQHGRPEVTAALRDDLADARSGIAQGQ